MIYLYKDEEIAKWMRAAPPSFQEWLEQDVNHYMNSLMNATDLYNVAKLQGRLELLALFKEVRKHVLES